MSIRTKLSHILAELKCHAPFTLLGAVLGLLLLLLFNLINNSGGHILFSIFHPAHVVLSAMVTTAIFRLANKNILLTIIIGYAGAIGVATLSDILIPHLGLETLGVAVPTHDVYHQHENDHNHADCDHGAEKGHEHGIHLGFIEEWYIVNPAAFLGIALAFFRPRTKFPHAAHVLVSTWASASYMLMQLTSPITVLLAAAFIFVLFVAVWLPCCISDIVFPLIFVKGDLKLSSHCSSNSTSKKL